MKPLCFLIIFMLLFLQLPCGLADEAVDTAPLLAEFSSLAQAKEQLYSIETEMYKAVLQFVISNDYDSLLAARMVCSQAVRDIRAFEPPEMTLSDSMILYYLKNGVEVDGLEAEFLSLRREASNFLAEAEALEACLYTAVYRVSSLPQLAALASSVKQLLDSSAVYDAYAVEYLLSPLAQEEKVQQFKHELGVYMPEEWLDAEPDQRSAAIQQKIGQLSAAERIVQNNYLLLSDTQDDLGSPSASQADDVNIIQGMPAMIPSPDWPGGETAALQPAEGQTASGAPVLMTRSFSNVTMEDFRAYYAFLASMGLGSFRFSDGGDAEKSAITLEGGSFTVSRTPDGQASAVYDPQVYSLEPAWYVQYAE